MTHLVLAVLTACAVAAPAYSDLSDYLPLNVGNSWKYRYSYHENLDHRAASEAVRENRTVTLRITSTQVIEGKTYYVFNDFYPDPNPAPPHSLFGRKVRWDGDSLMVYDGTSEYPLFRFEEISVVDEGVKETYAVDPSNAEGDTEVTRTDWLSTKAVYKSSFRFYGSSMQDISNPEYSRYVSFLRGYGMWTVLETVDLESDYSSFINNLSSEEARLLEPPTSRDGRGSESRSSDSGDAYREISRNEANNNEGLMRHDHGTGATNKSSWGQVKGGTYR